MQIESYMECEQTKQIKRQHFLEPLTGPPGSSAGRVQWSPLEQSGKLSHITVPSTPAPVREAQRCPQPAALSEDRSGRLAR